MTTINSLYEMHYMYEHTTIILGTQSLVMGITILILSKLPKQHIVRSRQGLIFLAFAMFVLSLINIAEYTMGIKGENEQYTLAVVVFAASIEMFLLWFAYMSMIDTKFISRRRVCTELGLIVVFTTPALLLPLASDSLLFYTLFVISVSFYVLKLMYNLYLYRRQINKITDQINNHISDESSKLLGWINSTFYIVLVIGVVSVVVPMTGFLVLTIYNIFIFLAYFYIYLSIIRNIDVFEQNMSVVEDSTAQLDLLPSEPYCPKERSFIAFRQKALDDWIAGRGYAVAGLTASEVASCLNTNRTKLSQYLKNELHISYYTWIAQLRIEDAKRQLIEHPDRSIYEIALNVGIEDRDNFRRVFIRFVGVSPSIYRKTYFENNS